MQVWMCWGQVYVNILALISNKVSGARLGGYLQVVLITATFFI